MVYKYIYICVFLCALVGRRVLCNGQYNTKKTAQLSVEEGPGYARLKKRRELTRTPTNVISKAPRLGESVRPPPQLALWMALGVPQPGQPLSQARKPETTLH